ncbi:type II secretion system F family protein [Azospirillum sp. sgz301742]
MNTVIEQVSLAASGSDLPLLFSIFAAVVLLVMGGLAVRPAAPSMEKRLGLAATQKSATSLSYEDKSARSLLRRLDRSLAPQDDKKRSSVLRSLVQAGYYSRYAVSVYYAIRVGLALALPLATLIAIPVAVGVLPVHQMYTLGMAALATGFFGPSIVLNSWISDRQRAVREAFPDALDLLLICVEAGLALNAALVRVSNELDQAHPLLCEHFRMVSQEMQAGASREAALRKMGERVGIEEVTALVSLLVQSESMGVSVAHTLRVYTSEMRRKRLLRAEEHANKLPVRMVLPLAGFVMPAFLIVIITPSVIRISGALLPALAGN